MTDNYQNKHVEDFIDLAEKISDTVDLNYYSSEPIDGMIKTIAREILDVYNQGYDDAIKQMGNLRSN